MAEIRFDEQRVLVTAAADGIGKAIAQGFLDAGARVHICDIDQAKLEAFTASHPNLSSTRTDIGNPAEIAELFEAVDAELGGLDILVSNAGIMGPVKPADEISLAEWQRTLDVNLTGGYVCAQHAIPRLKAQGSGSIVFISSRSGQFGVEYRTPYVASKWALHGLGKSLALELGPFGIRVNVVVPSGVIGDRIERVIAAHAEQDGVPYEEAYEEWVTGTALRARVRPEDVADLVLFACSGMAAKITGQILTVDAYPR
jgi:NAD(P)-dependent dehydrogenase (short-subunit alcohol dehydrogenase family)